MQTSSRELRSKLWGLLGTAAASLDDNPTRTDFWVGLFEGVGTMFFLFFALLGCQGALDLQKIENGATALDTTQYCAASFGTSLFVLVTVFFRITGGVFNPAIALSLFLTGSLRFWRWICITVFQLWGACLASLLVHAIHPGSTSVTNTIAPGVSIGQAVILEMFTTGLLVLTVLVAATDKRTAASKVLAPLSIAIALYIGHMTSIRYTGTSMNPARSFGPAVVWGFTSTHWVFWVGPISGSIIATLFYKLLHYVEYWQFGNCESEVEVDPLLPVFHPPTHDVQAEAFSNLVAPDAPIHGQAPNFIHGLAPHCSAAKRVVEGASPISSPCAPSTSDPNRASISSDTSTAVSVDGISASPYLRPPSIDDKAPRASRHLG
ncbi:aquaporin-like protein [Clavulina sp. PMI_390]|nr:aquaporin-like protein [Clavulina sp. PMI_390]